MCFTISKYAIFLWLCKTSDSQADLNEAKVVFAFANFMLLFEYYDNCVYIYGACRIYAMDENMANLRDFVF